MTGASLGIQGLDHVVLRARDPNRLIAFYSDVLGCPVERTLESIGLTQLRAGASLIDIIDASADLSPNGSDGPGNMDHFCLRVLPWDPDAITAHLARHGVEAGPVETRYGAEGYGPSIYFPDPEGNVVELRGPSGGPAGEPSGPAVGQDN